MTLRVTLQRIQLLSISTMATTPRTILLLRRLSRSDMLDSISVGKTTLFMLFYRFCCLGVESLRPVPITRYIWAPIGAFRSVGYRVLPSRLLIHSYNQSRDR